MNHIQQSVEERIAQSAEQYERTITAVRQGRPLAAETDGERVQSRIEADPSLADQAAEPLMDEALSFDIIDTSPGPERVWGNTADFVGVAFLERGVQATVRQRRGEDILAACGQLRTARGGEPPTPEADTTQRPS